MYIVFVATILYICKMYLQFIKAKGKMVKYTSRYYFAKNIEISKLASLKQK